MLDSEPAVAYMNRFICIMQAKTNQTLAHGVSRLRGEDALH